MKPTPVEIQKHLLTLQDTPPRLAVVALNLSEERLVASPTPNGWSALAILAHLRACAHLWSLTIYAALAEESPALPLLDERRWAKTAGYTHFQFQPCLQTFTHQRAELLAVLQPLPLPGWERFAIVEGRKHTVFSQVRRLALHEIEHCSQIEALPSA